MREHLCCLRECYDQAAEGQDMGITQATAATVLPSGEMQNRGNEANKVVVPHGPGSGVGGEGGKRLA